MSQTAANPSQPTASSALNADSKSVRRNPVSNSDRQLLSFGVFLIIIVVGILLAVAGVIGWGLFVPVVLVLCGLWAIALGGLRAGKPQKYERGSFSTMAVGLGLIVSRRCMVSIQV